MILLDAPRGMTDQAYAALLCHQAAWSRHAGRESVARQLERRAAELNDGELIPPQRWDNPDWLTNIRAESARLWRSQRAAQKAG